MAARAQQGGSGAARSAKLFLGGLTRNTTTQQLREHFVKYGRVLDCVAMRHPDGRPRGFGYVTLDTVAAAERCLMEPQVIDGRIIDMKKAVPGGCSGGSPTASAAAPRPAAQAAPRPPQALGLAAAEPPFGAFGAWDLAGAAAFSGFGAQPPSPPAAWSNWAAALSSAAGAAAPLGLAPALVEVARHQERAREAPTAQRSAAARPAPPPGDENARRPPPSVFGASPQKVALPSAVRAHRTVLAEIAPRSLEMEKAGEEAQPSGAGRSRRCAGKENRCNLPPGALAPRAAKVADDVLLSFPPGLAPQGEEGARAATARRPLGCAANASPMTLAMPMGFEAWC